MHFSQKVRHLDQWIQLADLGIQFFGCGRHVLDGLFRSGYGSSNIQEHFTDTGGASDHVFGLFALIGKRFAPRLRNLKGRKFPTFEQGDAYPALTNHIGAPINTTLILDHWDDLLHLAASITTRSVVPSTILKKLSASPKESQLAKALRELGRIERSLFMIEWYSSPVLRRRCQAGLNKARQRTNLNAQSSSMSVANSATGRSKVRHSAHRASILSSARSSIGIRSILTARSQNVGQEHSRDAAEAHLAAELGAHQPDRHLHLGCRASNA
ncbi:transposase Tn3 family protein [Mesorhizobium alhagi CCNWXJ12-2]|uniref:Transposase Tn3 family protein n=1 Tax=Mesorhizobium alhagi CCNWXJ12-2 TaxID=1107882 RepID=H0I131_9HYPH|nr:transposase Tn3 family protein [Mesorhizobium alhagi CCNWXJ12-2]